MRTVGQLSKLTGLSRRTVQYYAGEGDFEDSANCRGVLVPCEIDRNGCRKFDDDALFKLLAIKNLKWCGFKSRTIRGIIESRGNDFDSLAAIQLDALEEEKRKIDRQIAFVRMMRTAMPVLSGEDESDEEALAASAAMFVKLLVDSISRSLGRIDENLVFDIDDLDRLQYFEGAGRERDLLWLKTVGELVKEAGAGKSERAKESLALLLERKDNQHPGAAFSVAIDEVRVLFLAGIDPKAAEVQSQIDYYCRSAVPSGMLLESFVCASWISELLNEAEVASFLELMVGEGFADYVSRAVGFYKEAIRKKAKHNKTGRACALKGENDDSAV